MSHSRWLSSRENAKEKEKRKRQTLQTTWRSMHNNNVTGKGAVGYLQLRAPTPYLSIQLPLFFFLFFPIEWEGRWSWCGWLFSAAAPPPKGSGGSWGSTVKGGSLGFCRWRICTTPTARGPNARMCFPIRCRRALILTPPPLSAVLFSPRNRISSFSLVFILFLALV